MRTFEGGKVVGQLHTLAAMRLDATPVPLALDGQIDIAHIGGLVANLVLAAHPPARPLREHLRIAHHERRVDGQPAHLEDVLADAGRDNLPVPAASRVAGAPDLDAGEARVQPRGRLGRALGDKVRDDVHPLAVPAQDLGPHLVRLVRRHLLLEAALDGAEEDAQGPLDGRARRGVQHELALRVVRHVAQRGAEEVRDEVRARDVEVGEEGRVGLVQVVVDLQEGRVRRADDGLEERSGAQLRRLAEEVMA